MSGCRFGDYNPCMCGRRDYPDYTCRICEYSSGCVCGFEDYPANDLDPVDYDPDLDYYNNENIS